MKKIAQLVSLIFVLGLVFVLKDKFDGQVEYIEEQEELVENQKPKQFKKATSIKELIKKDQLNNNIQNVGSKQRLCLSKIEANAEIEKTLQCFDVKNKKKLIADIKKACSDNQESFECRKARQLASFELIKYQSEGKELSELTTSQLMVKLIEPFEGGDINKIDFSKVKEIAQKVINIDDTIYAAHKVNLIADLLPVLMKKEDANPQNAMKALSQMEGFDYVNHDPQIMDARAIFYLQTDNKEELKKFYKKVREDYPQEGYSHYYEAMYYDQAGLKDKMSNALKKAIEMDPHNKKFRETYEDFKKGKKNFFQFSLTFDFNDL